MFFDRLHENLVARQRVAGGLLQLFYQPNALLGADAAGPAIGNRSIRGSAGKVAAGGQVIWLQFKANAHRLKHAPPNFVLDRIVAEEAEVGRATAGFNPRPNSDTQPGGPVGSQTIQIRGLGGLQFRLTTRFQRQAAQTVQNQQDDFTAVAVKIFH
jgi:hypothetical protein